MLNPPHGNSRLNVSGATSPGFTRHTTTQEVDSDAEGQAEVTVFASLDSLDFRVKPPADDAGSQTFASSFASSAVEMSAKLGTKKHRGFQGAVVCTSTGLS